MAGLLLVACGGDGDDYCVPQGRVTIGAAGTVGAPMDSFADCYGGTMPVVSLDGARGATATGNSITFDDSGLTATVDDATCRVSITYTFDSMLSDDTPATGTSRFAADPDPDGGGTWNEAADASTEFEWSNDMGGTSVCGNQVTGAVIAIEGG